MTDKYLIVVAGPTAVGKTSLCLQLAKDLNTEIVSADSRQFYQELTIGTAKPTREELQQVRHHFINTQSIANLYSAGDFERDALTQLDKIFARKDCVVVTGGSGLYIKALCEGLDFLPQPEAGLREELSRRLREDGLDFLQAELQRVDPLFAQTSEFCNPQRVVRALEVYYSSGLPMSSFHSQAKAERPFRQLLIGLDRDRTELYQRIEARMDQMLADGLVEEARQFQAYRAQNALQTVGYKEVYGFLDGNYDYQEMVRILKQNSRRYAKRQLTWFRHQGNYTWFHPDQYQELKQYILDQMYT
ncbi:tRNA (adenosine(37)-N6)-dimethylallyltransferase MiaA [Arundinibacter roseus]|uniref:tRNA (adenosine(37)-N6)-dimethylallyltransferase MiaA n=1 Tax=Arundinibacter roseus TaxID=2070510 RepID=UPI0026C1A525|nr:tRNA (adenosine(37)-N6)-dimethylallyltransferase MiaA [Arundinibacter roseus]